MVNTFSYFIHSRDKIQLKIHLDYFLLIQEIDDTTSELYFRDLHYHHIDIPSGVLVMNASTNIPITALSTNNFHFLHDQNYNVTINGNYFFSFKNKNNWNTISTF